jgi:hypothetical protein
MTRSFTMAPAGIRREAIQALFACSAGAPFPEPVGHLKRAGSALEEEQHELLEVVRQEMRSRPKAAGCLVGEVCRELLAHLAGAGLQELPAGTMIQ